MSHPAVPDAEQPPTEPPANHCLDSATEILIEDVGMTADDDKGNIIDIEKLAELLDVSEPVVRKLIKDGTIPSSRVGHQIRIWWPNVRDYLVKGKDFVPTDE